MALANLVQEDTLGGCGVQETWWTDHTSLELVLRAFLAQRLGTQPAVTVVDATENEGEIALENRTKKRTKNKIAIREGKASKRRRKRKREKERKRERKTDRKKERKTETERKTERETCVFV